MNIGAYRDKLTKAGFDSRLVWSARQNDGTMIAKLEVLGPHPSRAVVTSCVVESVKGRRASQDGIFVYWESVSARFDHDLRYLRGLVAAAEADAPEAS